MLTLQVAGEAMVAVSQTAIPAAMPIQRAEAEVAA
jgi:hypothetical protein